MGRRSGGGLRSLCWRIEGFTGLCYSETEQRLLKRIDNITHRDRVGPIAKRKKWILQAGQMTDSVYARIDNFAFGIHESS